MNVGVSDAEFGFLEQQTRDALQFLADNEAELQRLASWPGVDGLELDFAVYGHDGFVQSCRFTPELLAQIGRLGVTLCVSYYAPSQDATQHVVGPERGQSVL